MKRREPINNGVSPLFLAKKNGGFTSEIDFSTLLRKFFLGVCGIFPRNVGCFFADVERLKVKRYLFFEPFFFSFKVTTQVDYCSPRMQLGAP